MKKVLIISTSLIASSNSEIPAKEVKFDIFKYFIKKLLLFTIYLYLSF